MINETLAEIYGWVATRDILMENYDIGSDPLLGPLVEVNVAPDGSFVGIRDFSATGDAARDIFSLRYGGTVLGAEVVELYNCIGDPQEAFEIFKVMESPTDVQAQLLICRQS